VCVKWHGVLEVYRKIGKQERMHNYRSISTLNLHGKITPRGLKNAANKLNQSWRILSAVFVLAVALQTKFSLSSKFSRNLGSIPKMFTYVLSTSRSHTTGTLVKSFGECCEKITGGRDLTPSSHYIHAQMFLSVWAELNHNRSPWVLDSNKCVCYHHSS